MSHFSPCYSLPRKTLERFSLHKSSSQLMMGYNYLFQFLTSKWNLCIQPLPCYRVFFFFFFFFGNYNPQNTLGYPGYCNPKVTFLTSLCLKLHLCLFSYRLQPAECSAPRSCKCRLSAQTKIHALPLGTEAGGIFPGEVRSLALWTPCQVAMRTRQTPQDAVPMPSLGSGRFPKGRGPGAE